MHAAPHRAFSEGRRRTPEKAQVALGDAQCFQPGKAEADAAAVQQSLRPERGAQRVQQAGRRAAAALGDLSDQVRDGWARRRTQHQGLDLLRFHALGSIRLRICSL